MYPSPIPLPLWGGLREVTGTLDTVRKIRSILGTLNSTGNEIDAYNLIIAVYGFIAAETLLDIIELETYPYAIKQFITEFLLGIDDLLIDYESEE